MQTGTDIVKISRMEKITANGVPKKIFSDREIEYISSKSHRAQTAAGMYAAKEAYLKAVGKGIFSVPLSSIEVLHRGSGMPYISVSGNGNISNMPSFADVSIAHDGEYAVAFVTLARDENHERFIRAISVFDNCADDVIAPPEIAALLPKRAADMHKGTCGRLFAAAGSRGLTGAAIMSCRSALRCGAGLVTLGCCGSLNDIFESSLLEAMTLPLPDENGTFSVDAAKNVAEKAAAADVCLAGPGIGRSSGAMQVTYFVTAARGVRAVIDADGLYALAQNKDILASHGAELILTPHIGEFSALTGLDAEFILQNTKKLAAEFAQKYNVTLVLKSHRTIVAAPDGKCFENILGNPGMATGGSGDVLAGAIASFAAQGMSSADAAKAGVFIHSLAADMAAADKGEYSLLPEDIIETLPYAIKYISGR